MGRWGPEAAAHLLHPQVGDAGLYTCLAQSPAGEVEKSFRVRIQGKDVGVGAGDGGRVGPAGVGPSLMPSLPAPSTSTHYRAPRPPLRGWPGPGAAGSGVLGGGRSGP